MSAYRLIRSYDPGAFLQVTGPFLYSQEAENNLILSWAEGLRAGGYIEVHPNMLHLSCDGNVVGVIGGTDKRRVAVSDFPREALPLIARSLLSLSPRPKVLIGPKSVMTDLALRISTETLQSINLNMSQKILKLAEVSMPLSCAGEIRLANTFDVPKATRWLLDFMFESTPNDLIDPSRTRQLVENKISRQQVYFWCVQGKPVSCTYLGRSTKNGITINSVYTPRIERGRGYASNLVAEVSRRMLRNYKFCVLYTDAENRTSNKIYQAIGYCVVS